MPANPSSIKSQMQLNDSFPDIGIGSYIAFFVIGYYIIQVLTIVGILYIVPHFSSAATLQHHIDVSLNVIMGFPFAFILLLCLAFYTINRFYKKTNRIFNSREYKRFLWSAWALLLVDMLIKLAIFLPPFYGNYVANYPEEASLIKIAVIIGGILRMIVWLVLVWLSIYSALYVTNKKSLAKSLNTSSKV